MDNSILDVNFRHAYESSITSSEYHSHQPFTTQAYDKNDEIRIVVNPTENYTQPGESFIHIQGKVTAKAGKDIEKCSMVANAVAFLFDEIRYELAGIEVDRIKNVGISSVIKNYITLTSEDLPGLSHSSFYLPSGTAPALKTAEFSFCIPLKNLFSVFESYSKIILNIKQEIIFLRNNSDADALYTKDVGDADGFEIKVDKIEWRVPHVTVDELMKLKLLKLVNSDRPISIPFHKWEMFENPNLPTTNSFTWTLKTSSQANKPRYAIVAFQTGRKHVMTKNSSLFDKLAVSDIKLWLNSTYFPYNQNHGNTELFFDMYRRFKHSYFSFDGHKHNPLLSLQQYKEIAPIYAINCSRQNESIKGGTVDVRLEVQTSVNIPANTIAYCILIYDDLVQYTPLTGIVKRIQ